MCLGYKQLTLFVIIYLFFCLKLDWLAVFGFEAYFCDILVADIIKYPGHLINFHLLQPVFPHRDNKRDKKILTLLKTLKKICTK